MTKLTESDNCPNCHNRSLKEFIGPAPVYVPQQGSILVQTIRCDICTRLFYVNYTTRELLWRGE